MARIGLVREQGWGRREQASEQWRENSQAVKEEEILLFLPSTLPNSLPISASPFLSQSCPRLLHLKIYSQASLLKTSLRSRGDLQSPVWLLSSRTRISADLGIYLPRVLPLCSYLSYKLTMGRQAQSLTFLFWCFWQYSVKAPGLGMFENESTEQLDHKIWVLLTRGLWAGTCCFQSALSQFPAGQLNTPRKKQDKNLDSKLVIFLEKITLIFCRHKKLNRAQVHFGILYRDNTKTTGYSS